MPRYYVTRVAPPHDSKHDLLIRGYVNDVPFRYRGFNHIPSPSCPRWTWRDEDSGLSLKPALTLQLTNIAHLYNTRALPEDDLAPVTFVIGKDDSISGAHAIIKVSAFMAAAIALLYWFIA